MARSFFIVIEGIDGAGKGEVIARLHTRLFSLDKRFRILSTREPTYGPIGLRIRQALATDTDPLASPLKYLQWYCEDRAEHVHNVISPFLENADGENAHIVLCDRYFYSTLAYQQA